MTAIDDGLTPMNDLVRPFNEVVVTRGVVTCDGKGNMFVCTFDITVTVEVAGVRAVLLTVGDGGNTNRV